MDETLEDDQVTWNVKLSWAPNNDILLYAGYATGFKPGGTNADRIPAMFSQVFGAEKTDVFEVGAKLAFPRHNLRNAGELEIAWAPTAGLVLQARDLDVSLWARNG